WVGGGTVGPGEPRWGHHEVDGLHPAGNHVLAPAGMGPDRAVRRGLPFCHRLGFHPARPRRRLSLQAPAAFPWMLPDPRSPEDKRPSPNRRRRAKTIAPPAPRL